MPRVSLILPTLPGDPNPAAMVPAFRSALEAEGHEVEVIVAHGPSSGESAGFRDGWHAVVANDAGLASSAMAGLHAATGDILLVLDPAFGFGSSALTDVVKPLAEGQAELVVGSRNLPASHPGFLRRLMGKAVRPFTGTTDPLTGLVGVSRSALDASVKSFRAVGSKFSLEMLSKVEGRRMDVPARVEAPSRRGVPGWDDLRHLKRLADHRYGNLSRLAQFCFVGASGMVVDLTCYFLFQKLYNQTSLENFVIPTGRDSRMNVALAAARASAIAVALVWNFTLNRRLTFSYARVGSLPRQFAIYVASNLLGVFVSMALSLDLLLRIPFFNQHKLLAAVVGIVAATGISFSMSRWVVFRNRPSTEDVEADLADELDSAEVLAP